MAGILCPMQDVRFLHTFRAHGSTPGLLDVWGLEKHPMQAFFGYDVAADLRQETRYEQIVEAVGGYGERVTSPDEIGPALKRAFDAGVPALLNVITDPKIAY